MTYLLYIEYQNFTKIQNRERYIVGSSSCSINELSIVMVTILFAGKEGIYSYSDKVYSRSNTVGTGKL